MSSIAIDLAAEAYRRAEQARDEGMMARAQVIATLSLTLATIQAAGHQTPSLHEFQNAQPKGPR